MSILIGEKTDPSCHFKGPRRGRNAFWLSFVHNTGWHSCTPAEAVKIPKERPAKLWPFPIEAEGETAPWSLLQH
jgi:hypothetical protein